MIFKCSADRNGYTLIEMIIAMSILMILMAINAKWIHESIKFASKVDDRKRQHLSLDRLDNKLRQDIRQSNSMALENRSLTLTFDDELVVTYSIDGTRITIVKERDSKIVFQDRFELGNRADIQWDSSEMPEWISLVVRDRNPTLRSNPDAAMRIDYYMRAAPNPWRNDEN